MAKINKARTMEWGSANRPKVSNRLGIPHRSEGSDGDMQVRQTSIGARLFSKLGGKWLSNMLYGDELDNPSIFIPKVWVHRGTTDGDDTTTVFLPDFIAQSRVISISFMINLGGNSLHVWTWDTPGASGVDDELGEHGRTHQHHGVAELHIDDDNRIELSLNRTTSSVVMSHVGSSAQSKEYRLSVFFN